MGGGIEVRGLSKRFGSRTALDMVSFHCPPGCVTGYLGPNGAGKSTTLRIALGLTVPDAGEVLFAGQRFGKSESLARRVGVVLGADALPSGMRASDALRRRARFLGVEKARVKDLVSWVGLEGQVDKRVKNLSLGQKQRLGIAMAFVTDPEFLVMDEPFNGLDPEGIVWLRELLRSHASRGGCALVSSHLIAELEEIVGHVVILRDGRTTMEGLPVQNVRAQTCSVIFRDREMAEAALTAAELRWQRQGTQHHVEAPTLKVGELAAAYGLVMLELKTAPGLGLEQLYMDSGNQVVA